MNGIPKELLLSVGGALLCAFAVSFLMCPLVKSFAYKIGAIDVPKDNRRMHKKPVPRLGGLAIFLGFIVSMLLFVKVDHQLQGILLGASIIVVLGVVDDMSPLRAYFKFCVQIFAALVAVVAAFATLGAAFVRVFRRPLERWFEWVEDSFYGGGRR